MIVLEKFRKLKGLSQAALAKRCGVHFSLICAVERENKAPWPKLEKKLEEIFGIPSRHLFHQLSKDKMKIIPMRNLIKLRRDKGLSAKELAKLCDCSYSIISDLEGGRHRPWPSIVVKLERILNVPKSEILKDYFEAGL